MLQKVANDDQTSAILDIKSYLTLLHNYPPQEQSDISEINWRLLEGDHMLVYGKDLEWLIPYQVIGTYLRIFKKLLSKCTLRLA